MELKNSFRIFRYLIIFISLVFIVNFIGNKESNVNKLDLKDKFFRELEGSFVLYNEKEDAYFIYNENKARERVSPCSTFKIASSLIGLETGVIKDENHKYKWNGMNYPIKSWNRDHTLQSAIKNSVVWYYQMLASYVGYNQMEDYLKRIDYGNNDISGGITKFWLSSSLKISAMEQVEFLKKLYNYRLPYSKKNIDIVKKIIELEKSNEYEFSGKTGTSGYGLGWFVGVIRKGDNRYYFALNLFGNKEVTGYTAKETTIEILKEMGIYEKY